MESRDSLIIPEILLEFLPRLFNEQSSNKPWNALEIKPEKQSSQNISNHFIMNFYRTFFRYLCKNRSMNYLSGFKDSMWNEIVHWYHQEFLKKVLYDFFYYKNIQNNWSNSPVPPDNSPRILPITPPHIRSETFLWKTPQV